MIISPENFVTRSLRSSAWGNDICRILSAAIHTADAGQCVKNKLSLDADELNINDLTVDLSAYQRIFVLGAGKAAVPMVEAVRDILGSRITSGIVITKEGYAGSENTLLRDHIELIQAGHPVPDLRNLDASSRLVTLTNNLSSHDLVICLFSGGSSSLMVFPSPGLALKDIQGTTSLLLSCGASINEINTVRKHLEVLKGGGLAKMLFPAEVISLILSDVVGDRLDMVASGPTVADPTTYVESRVVLEKYKVWHRLPPRVRTHLSAGIKGMIAETVKPGDPALGKVHNILVGNNSQVTLAAMRAAKDLGFRAELLPITLEGEAALIGPTIIERAKTLLASYTNTGLPTCLITGGETTVTVNGNGKGGRNQELALGAVKSLSSDQPMVLVSIATDGGDGPTDAAGAVATNQTYHFGLSKGLDPSAYLLRNDSYTYFDLLGDLIKIGPTLTNVNDLLLIFGR